MKLFPKLALLVLAVALVPLGVVGFGLIRAQRGTLASLLEEKQAALASAAAERTGRELKEIVSRVVNVVRLLDVASLGDEEKLGLVRAIYRQSDDIVSAAWLDQAGRLVAERAALTGESSPDEARVRVSAEHARALDAMGEKLAALASGVDDAVTTDAVFFLGRKLPSMFIVLSPIPNSRETIIVEVVLRAATRAFEELPERAMGVLLARDGKLLVRSADEVPLEEQLTLPKDRRTFRFADKHGQRAAGATAAVPDSALSILIFESEASAFALVREMQGITLAGLAGSTILSLVVGYLASRGLRRRLSHYDQVARGLGAGQLALRITVDTEDELGVLGGTLNDMARDLEKSRAEIEAFNRDLQKMVEERTAQLVEAQNRLVQAARLAAVGHLGAGVAHEIGNPLARIIGYTQLLQIDPALSEASRESILKIEAAAKRVDSITKALLRFSETQQLPAEEGLPLAGCVDEAVGLVREQVEGKGITLAAEVDTALKVRGQRSQLTSAMFQLLDNAKTACAEGAAIVAYCKRTDEGTWLGVRDNGPGIAPEHKDKLFDPFFTTKKNWDSPGLGLSLVYRIAESHGATLRVDTELGRGTDIAMLFPAMPPKA